MLNLTASIVQRRIATLLAKRPAVGNMNIGRSRQVSHPGPVQQRRSVAQLEGKRNPNNMGGPGGQESLPASKGLRRYAIWRLFSHPGT